eukprot:GILI01015861.1.p1 GENE.GILI01015861.1~~GILI01015861.1.p1  ORF type:complete len:441 (+),score=102.52 GILI01015861.1:41-1324(+)
MQSFPDALFSDVFSFLTPRETFLCRSLSSSFRALVTSSISTFDDQDYSGINIRPQRVNLLCASLVSRAPLTSVCIHGKKGPFVTQLLQALLGCPTLEKLLLKDCLFDSGSFLALKAGLPLWPRLTHLEVTAAADGAVTLTDEEFPALAALLPCSLQLLAFNNHALNEPSMGALAEVLQRCPQLHTLSLHALFQCRWKAQNEVESLTNNIAALKELKNLDLSRNSISIPVLNSLLSSVTHLHSLNLSGVPVGINIQCLKEFSQLRELSLQDCFSNQIAHAEFEMRRVAAALSALATSLTHLDLSRNFKADEERFDATTVDFSLWLLPLTNLTHLKLANCRLDCDVFPSVADAIRELKALKHLDLRGNQLTNQGPVLQGIVRHLHSLTYLDVSNCALGRQAVQSVATLLPSHCPDLRSFVSYGNEFMNE